MAAFNDLSVQHSRNIGDTVASGSTDGNLFTSAQRANHLNRAIKRWLLVHTSLKNYNALLSFITNVTSTTSSGGAYTLSAVLGIISVLCDSKFIKRGNEIFFSQYQSAITNGNSFLAPTATEPVYIYNAGAINLYPAASFNAKSITVHYVKQWTDLAYNSTATIDVPDHYTNQILDFALIEAMNEIPSDISMARSKDKKELAMSELALINEVVKEG